MPDPITACVSGPALYVEMRAKARTYMAQRIALILVGKMDPSTLQPHAASKTAEKIGKFATMLSEALHPDAPPTDHAGLREAAKYVLECWDRDDIDHADWGNEVALRRTDAAIDALRAALAGGKP